MKRFLPAYFFSIFLLSAPVAAQGDLDARIARELDSLVATYK